MQQMGKGSKRRSELIFGLVVENAIHRHHLNAARRGDAAEQTDLHVAEGYRAQRSADGGAGKYRHRSAFTARAGMEGTVTATSAVETARSAGTERR
jgi:hypothetical protein